MIAAYTRVSTRDQSTQSQRAEIERWLSGNGIQAEPVSWYEDQESGTTLQRPEFERLKGATDHAVQFKLLSHNYNL